MMPGPGDPLCTAPLASHTLQSSSRSSPTTDGYAVQRGATPTVIPVMSQGYTRRVPLGCQVVHSLY
jgi:hypothetical protein